jgi:hypothetical protein
MEDMAANIIAYGTVFVTVGFCVWFGIRAGLRSKRYPRKIEYIDDGFVYHDMLSDKRVRWRDITLAEVKLEMHRGASPKYGRAKTTKYRALDITAGRKSFVIFAEDFEKVNFDEFIAAIEQRVRESNPQFRGIGGEVDKFRKDIPSSEPEVDAGEEAAENELDRRIESRVAALGREASRKERIAIFREEQSKMDKERRKK